MNLTIVPHPLSGKVTPPASKSQGHRMLIAAALAPGKSVLQNLSMSKDLAATLQGIEALGARSRQEEDELHLWGISAMPSQKPALPPRLDCGESGSTLRFLIPVALAVAGGGIFTGHGRLMERPQQPYFELFREKGIDWQLQEGALTVRGTLLPGEYPLRGDVSSQFVTGLLYALPLLPGASHIRLTTPLESRDYVEITIGVLRSMGVDILPESDGFRIPGNQRPQAGRMTVEGDWSQGAFWYAASFLGQPLEIEGLHPDSLQGDRRIADDYWKLARPGEVTLDVTHCPDLVPPLAVMAALRRGKTAIVGAGRLRFKESDRLAAVTTTLNRLGAQVTEREDGLLFEGVDRLRGGVTIDCWNDHRIAMMAAVAAIRCEQPVTLCGADCVEKSYPTFWEDYQMLGGKLSGILYR